MQPEQYLPHRYLALVAEQQGRLDEAVKELGQALRLARQQKPAVVAQLYGQRAGFTARGTTLARLSRT